MRAIFVFIFLFLFSLNAHSEEKKSCISGSNALDILKNVVIKDEFSDDDLRLVYNELMKSGVLVYDTPRPYLYSTNLFLTRFAKRICHDQICDSGDYIGAMSKCSHANLEEGFDECIVIAATKGKDLYCLLTPNNWDRFQLYDPFQKK